MSELPSEVIEAVQDLADLGHLARMGAAKPADLSDFYGMLATTILMPALKKHNLLGGTGTRRSVRQNTKPYVPRYDPALATPRLPEKEWWPLRRAILRRDKFQCRYCGILTEQMCVDHVVPLSRGGSNKPDNLVAACIPCNSSKSDRLLSEWKGRYQ